MKSFNKVVNPGSVEIGTCLHEMFVCIEYRPNGELSIRGVVGPWHSGNCAGPCGQCDEELDNISVFHKGWSKAKVRKFRQVWNDWHLNHMRPGCVHQAEWDPSKELLLPDGKKKKAGWVTHEAHPEGLLDKPCPVCGYKYGTEWKKQDVPGDVLDWLYSLPDTKINSAWV
jgi:hypothetical protein